MESRDGLDGKPAQNTPLPLPPDGCFEEATKVTLALLEAYLRRLGTGTWVLVDNEIIDANYITKHLLNSASMLINTRLGCIPRG